LSVSWYFVTGGRRRLVDGADANSFMLDDRSVACFTASG